MKPEMRCIPGDGSTGGSHRARNHGIRVRRASYRRGLSDAWPTTSTRPRSNAISSVAAIRPSQPKTLLRTRISSSLRSRRRARLKPHFSDDDGVANGVSAGSVILDMGTFPLELKHSVQERFLGHGASVLDTPVSGTGSQAATRDLVVFASGDRAAFEKARAALDAVAREVRYVGEFGNGSKLKYIANLLVTIHNLSTAEAMVLAEKAGIDGTVLLEMLGDSAASSRMMQVRGPMMAAHRYEPATMRLEVYQKDLDIIDAFAKSLDCPTPLFSASLPFYAGAIAEGRGKQDTAAIVTVLRESAGLTPE